MNPPQNLTDLLADALREFLKEDTEATRNSAMYALLRYEVQRLKQTEEVNK